MTEHKNPVESELTHFGTLKLLLLEHQRIEDDQAETRRYWERDEESTSAQPPRLTQTKCGR